MKKMALSALKLDPGIYPRKATSEVHVARLLAAVSMGTKLPPIIVDSDSSRVIDGWHRYKVYSKLEVEEVGVTLKSYASEADLFADAVRLNIAHGEPLDHYSIQNAIIRLEKYGYQREQISQVVHMPIAKIERIERGFASDTKGEPLAVKSGLSHLGGTQITSEQQTFNKGYGGTKIQFYVNQLARMLELGIYPHTDTFAASMDRIVALWIAARDKATAA